VIYFTAVFVIFTERASRERNDASGFPASGFSASGIPAPPCSGAGP
jgi:hypothetical protein